jgi:hypothetical protein
MMMVIFREKVVILQIKHIFREKVVILQLKHIVEFLISSKDLKQF